MSSYEKVMEKYDEAIAVQAAIYSAPQAPAASIPASALAPSQGLDQSQKSKGRRPHVQKPFQNIENAEVREETTYIK